MLNVSEETKFLYDEIPTQVTEIRFGDLALLSFENMTQEQEEQFKELVKKANGTVQIWIHSHYDEYKDLSPAANDYKNLRNKALSASNPAAMPIISFIETPLDDTANLYAYGKAYSELMKGQIYYVPTFQDSSVPYILNKEDMFVSKDTTEVANWDIIGSKLAAFGVRKIIIRGRNFEYIDIKSENFSLAQDIYAEKKSINNGTVTIPDKCAGSAVVQLEARGFRILNTNITYPEHLK